MYDRPATLLVARFVGSPAINLLDGVLSTNGVFRIGVGTSIDMAGYAFTGPERRECEVVLAVRPDHVQGAGDSAADRSALVGLRVFAESLGPRSLFWLDVAGTRWSMFINAGKGKRPSGRISARIRFRPRFPVRKIDRFAVLGVAAMSLPAFWLPTCQQDELASFQASGYGDDFMSHPVRSFIMLSSYSCELQNTVRPPRRRRMRRTPRSGPPPAAAPFAPTVTWKIR